MKTRMVISSLLLCLLLSPAVRGQDGGSQLNLDPGEPALESALNEMRLRAEGEEQRVFRIIQQPGANELPRCSAIQQTRQRLRDIGDKESDHESLNYDTFNVEVGHDDMTIQSNDGTINNNVNVEVVNPNAQRCL